MRRREWIPLVIAFSLPLSTGATSARLAGMFDLATRAYVIDGQWVAQESIEKLRRDCSSTVSGTMLVDSRFSESSLSGIGWKITARMGDIVTARGCESTAPALLTLPGVLSVKTRSFMTNSMDVVRATIGADVLHGTVPSTGLPGKFTGRGVLVGIIDSEFDTHHPAFTDSLGRTRFLALWDHLDSTGAKKNSYGYGTIKDRSGMDADSAFGTAWGEHHGTLVGSVAAGGDRKSPYYGIAPDATLIGVRYGRQDANIVDALKWIFHIADSVRMPCVINMSIGAHDGPHDGNSIVDRAISSLVDSGKIVVGAAGNDGDMALHRAFTFSSTADKKGTWALQRPRKRHDPPSMLTYAALDIWGESGRTFAATVQVLDTASKQFYQSKRSFNSYLNGTYMPDTIVITRDGAKDTVYIQAMSERSSALNWRPHIQVVLFSRTSAYALGVMLSGSGTVHLWNIAQEPLRSYDMANYYGGDTAISINEIGGTSKHIIAVGAYTTKTVVTLWNGVVSVRDSVTEIGQLADFSSWGPTLDGRIKPEITAPGHVGVAAMSRSAFDGNDVVVWPGNPQPHGRYLLRSGTSSSAPVVAGVIALMLQAKPKLTRAEIMSIFAQTATKDKFTGQLTTPDNRWGVGKVNALAAVSRVIGAAVPAIDRPTGHNPAQLRVHGSNIEFEGGSPNADFALNIYDLQGRLLLSSRTGKSLRLQVPRSLNGRTLLIRAVQAGGIVGERLVAVP